MFLCVGFKFLCEGLDHSSLRTASVNSAVKLCAVCARTDNTLEMLGWVGKYRLILFV